MALIQVGRHHELMLPKGMIEALRLKPGDWLHVELRENQIVLAPAVGERAEWSEEELRAVRKYLETEEAKATAHMKLEEGIEEVHR
ncbi:MAG: AbrB/MazE/SpoVT family DNA-binding domain-containing protein [Candidatus Bipolaricaulota bacterium]|nr:AbrB/MazE/SpoVT family DNA-binding domain-containing protein [Candidatus Bipolaricaulota bacterium]MCS7273996.1 AbrB/MazE/SpoVT family DNA-binding domain-containing protein [Candidatus Bipolaricaulota bacterium]MDW8111349.1 AbrB/MazE/SpoVT family DNA-binding domain-containing protein [Candidatus Bipolaricaulota bacterium]MDW8329231.1 AbrB/MazE/SpoVT family DNA-binding domain-containing protein [Candidatus Bipolaricaulota bacterium]